MKIERNAKDEEKICVHSVDSMYSTASNTPQIKIAKEGY